MESITGPITRIISREGMPAVYEALDAEGKKIFEKVLRPLTPLALACMFHCVLSGPLKLTSFKVPTPNHHFGAVNGASASS